MKKVVYGGTPEILKYKKFDAIPVLIDDEGVKEENCKKIMKAGTILGGKDGSLIGTNNKLAVEKEGADAEGVLLYDVDLTDGPNQAAMVFRGDINESKLPKEVSEETKEALKTRILFHA